MASPPEVGIKLLLISLVADSMGTKSALWGCCLCTHAVDTFCLIIISALKEYANKLA